MMQADRSKTIRRGTTLVELLIVVSIILLLAAFALPAMQTGMQSRRMREAARAVNVYFGSAKVRALETGRPVGVLLERSETDPRACVQVRQVEVPPPYAGDFDGAVIRVKRFGSKVRLQAQFMMAMFPLSNGLISPGNRVQLNHQGPYYTIQPPSGTDFPVDGDGYFDFTTLTDVIPATPDGWVDETLTLVVEGNQANLPWPSAQFSGGMPFRIIRNPMPSSVAPLKLPRGMVIDLDDSGYGTGTPDLLPGPPSPYPSMAKDSFAARDVIYGDTTAKSFRPVLVMFGPDGSVGQVYHSYFVFDPSGGKILTYGSQYVQDRIFFMIGRAERTGDTNDLTYVTPPPEDGLENWQDASNLWLALNPQTGQTTIAEVHANLAPGAAGNPTADTYVPSNLFWSRSLARQAQVSMGGR